MTCRLKRRNAQCESNVCSDRRNWKYADETLDISCTSLMKCLKQGERFVSENNMKTGRRTNRKESRQAASDKVRMRYHRHSRHCANLGSNLSRQIGPHTSLPA